MLNANFDTFNNNQPDIKKHEFIVSKKFDRDFWVRISWLVVLLPLCFMFPLLLFAVILVIMGLCKHFTKDSFDKKINNQKQIQQLSWLNATPEDDWYDLFMAECESPAEEQFLAAMIRELNLKPSAGKLVCSLLTLEMQVRSPPYRFDFLVNGRQVVEIDGAAWHSSPEQVERDRIRDKISLERGYRVLRIPAKVVFRTPNEAVRRVKATLTETPFYTNIDFAKVKEPENSPARILSPLGFLSAISVALGELNEKASRMQKEAEEKEKAAKLEASNKVNSVLNEKIVSTNSQSIPVMDEELRLIIEECSKIFDDTKSDEKIKKEF
ncbi:hypothetical protein C3408_05605 [Candidatus Pantoea alvi]|uniref:endonuclease domain-containing protein n=1 Tax=Enterobacter agglomerans TaxID=549 RepID=UPI000CDCF4EB|nr:DUF559 domain-containing protein [Pantoea agglomerans]POW59044.1 hypothetical protein C3408_05605 [Pantoea alvi]UBN54939.1 DUF559 domain-containing protein [Pantoea agglomerans]